MLASRDSKRDKNQEHNTKNMRYKPFCTDLLTSYPMNDMRNFWWLIRKICVMILGTNG